MKSFIACSALLAMVISCRAVHSITNRCKCNNEFEPVCGTDGVTYDNSCKLSCQQVQLQYLGECSNRQSGSMSQSLGHCACPAVYDPICGTDGNTYSNTCLLECAGAKIQHLGECKTLHDHCQCPAVHAPVCGHDGKTYENVCEMACEGVRRHYMGVCGDLVGGSMDHAIATCACRTAYDPVCGKDGNTYRNPCFMVCAGAQQEHEGECVKSYNEQYCKCPVAHRPVCGIDGITYNNACFMLCAGQLMNHTGECIRAHEPVLHESKVIEMCSCPTDYEPACSTDGNTYRNRCFMSCARVKLDYMGECNIPKCNERCYCPTRYEPVCGNNKVTYKNTCCMMCANIRLLHVGFC